MLFRPHHRAAAWESELQNTASAQWLCRWLATQAHMFPALPRTGLNSQRFYCRLNYILTNLYVWATKKWYLKIDYVKRFPSRELEEIESKCQSLLSGSLGDRQAPTWSLWQFINRQYLISSNLQSQECMKNKSWWKLKLRKGSFWEYQSLSKWGEPAFPAITLDWILHDNSMLAASQLAGTACCNLCFCEQIKPHDAFISFLCMHCFEPQYIC